MKDFCRAVLVGLLCLMLLPVSALGEDGSLAMGGTKVEEPEEDGDTRVTLRFRYKGEEMVAEAEGNGPINAAIQAIRRKVPSVDVHVLNYSEHALSEGSEAKAAAYIQMEEAKSGRITFGVGVSSNITRASIRGMFSALNRLSR